MGASRQKSKGHYGKGICTSSDEIIENLADTTQLISNIKYYPNSKAPKGDPKGAATLLALELLTGAQRRKGPLGDMQRRKVDIQRRKVHAAPKGHFRPQRR